MYDRRSSSVTPISVSLHFDNLIDRIIETCSFTEKGIRNTEFFLKKVYSEISNSPTPCIQNKSNDCTKSILELIGFNQELGKGRAVDDDFCIRLLLLY